MRGEAFLGLKNPENQGASGGSAPWTPAQGRCPWTPPGALKRAPGPHAFKTLRSLRSTSTIFIQPPAVTNPAHAHEINRQVEERFWCVRLRGSINLNFSTTYAVDCWCVILVRGTEGGIETRVYYSATTRYYAVTCILADGYWNLTHPPGFK